jgi:chromosome partitioning protein
VAGLREAGVGILPTPLLEKEAFRALFAIGGGFEALEMNGVFGADAARRNTQAFTADVVRVVEARGDAPAPETRVAEGT